MILFFDIDGTIWDNKNYIPESTIAGIRAARANGHKCFINSGRSRAFIYNKDLLGIGFDGIVSSCGCMIEYDGRIVYNRLINKEDGIITLETIRRYGFKPILEGPDYLYMDEADFMGDVYGEKVMREMGDRLLGVSENWGNWTINKMSCLTKDCDTKSCISELEKMYDFIIHNESVLEMVPKGYNKGIGIEEVCSLLGEKVENTIAFGDSVNDKEMLITAGTGVAMGGATDEIKEYADFVSTGLYENGISNALRHLGVI